MRKYEFHAEFRVETKKHIEEVTAGQKLFSAFEVPSRLSLLAQAMVTDQKPYAQVGDRRTTMGLKELIHSRDTYIQYITAIHEEFLKPLNLLTPIPHQNLLPNYSFFISFTFILAKPYISKDDEPFYIIDNPLKKEKVFKVPYVASSSWKGNLREAFRLEGVTQEDIERLFGNDHDAQKDFRAGRLYFYPTYFNQMDMEVINPHDRKKRVGKLPIYFEIAPVGAQGTFSLLYVPFDQIGQDEKDIKKQSSDYLDLVYKGLRAMMLDYGFSAKKSSGYGIVEDNFMDEKGAPTGCVWMKNAPVYLDQDTRDDKLPRAQMVSWQQQLHQKKMQMEGKQEQTAFGSFDQFAQLIQKIREA